MPKISVIVPVYKVEPYIHRCVDSILGQTFTDFELILVDDGSPDNCPDICDEYVANDSRVRVIHQENGGLSAARNAGIDWAFANSDSRWLTFIDSDDWVHPMYLEALYRAAVKNDAGISICGYMETAGEDPMVDTAALGAVMRQTEDFFVEKNVNAIIAWGKLYRKADFAEIRYPVGKIHEDEFTTYKILFRYEQAAVIEQPLYAYYQNQNGITKAEWTPRRLVAVDALEERAEFFRQNGFKKAYVCNVKHLIGILQYNIGIMRSYGGKYELICREYTERYERYLKSCLEGLPLKEKIDVRLIPFPMLHHFYVFWRCLFEEGPLTALKRTKEYIEIK